MMRVLIMLRPGRPPRRPTDVDSRRFPGLLKLNLDVRIARYARFAAAAKTMADPRMRPTTPAWLREFDLQLTKQTGKFETIN
jgi:hypothetical protein